MGRQRCEGGIRHDKPCYEGFSTRQEPARTDCGGALLENHSLFSGFLSRTGSLAHRPAYALSSSCIFSIR